MHTIIKTQNRKIYEVCSKSQQQMAARKILLLCLFIIGIFAGCKKQTPPNVDVDDIDTTTNPTNIENTYGFGLLNKVKGIWDGPVSSSTPLGSYPQWIVDFRPISESQISAKNELDTANDIHMSFFIAKHNGGYKVAFRNGGSFAGLKRVSYFLIDSVFESTTTSYYRFSEAVKGKSRAYSEVIFKGDSLTMKTYTNHYNQQASPSLHMTWRAKLQDTTSAQAAVDSFSFPQKTLTKDFTNTFDGLPEAIYYNSNNDPYPEEEQPYLGKAHINYSFLGVITHDPSKKVFIFLTTKPLITNYALNAGNLKYLSRYVILSDSDREFTFNYMHPGTYYLYPLYDVDGSNSFSSGDMVSTNNIIVTVPPNGTVSKSNIINYTVP